MRPWLVSALLWLYPRTWRSRYGEEYHALLELHPLTVRDMLDSVRGAWDAHLRAYHDGTTVALPRGAALAIFGAWLAFVVAGIELYAVVSDSPFVPAMRAHPPFALAWQILAGCAALSFVAIVIGAVPIFLGTLQYALTRRHDALPLLLVPIMAMMECGAYGLGAVAIALGWITIPPMPTFIEICCLIWTRSNLMIAIGSDLLFAFSVVASGAAIFVLIGRSEIDTMCVRVAGRVHTIQPYRIARLLARMLMLTMAVATLATLVWGLQAREYAPVAFGGNGAIWLGVTLVMASATAVATVAASHGETARHISA